MTAEDEDLVPVENEEGNTTKLVTLSNALVTAAKNLTRSERRIMMFGVAKIDPRKSDPRHLSVRIEAQDFAEQFGIDLKTAYAQLQSAGHKLFRRIITLKPGKDKKGADRLRELRWISSHEYKRGEGALEYVFSWEISTHLTLLKKEFTTYALQQAGSLRSIHSWLLMELFQQYKSIGWREIEIDDFHHVMEVTSRQRKNFAFLRTQIIEPAVKDLEDNDGWKIEWRPIKKGRKVAALHFKFKRDAQERLFPRD